MASEFMDIITTIIYIILFVIMMIFVFSMGMLKRYMPRREVLLVLLVAFLIGSIGGAFFLDPIYDELPSVASIVEKNMPDNQETLYLDLSSSVDINSLANDLKSTPGFISFKEESVTIPMWSFNPQEKAYYEDILGNIDDNYKSYNITDDGKIEIELADNYTSSQALKSFSDWYKLVYGETISYGQVHAVLVIESSSLDQFKQVLLNKGVVASKIEGPIQDKINNTNETMLNNFQFTMVCGGIGVIVAILGIYFDTIAVSYRRIKKFFGDRRKR